MKILVIIGKMKLKSGAYPKSLVLIGRKKQRLLFEDSDLGSISPIFYE